MGQCPVNWATPVRAKVYLFKAYSLLVLVLGVFIKLYINHHDLIPEHFHHSKEKNPILISSHFYSLPTPQVPGNTNIIFVSMDLPILDRPHIKFLFNLISFGFLFYRQLFLSEKKIKDFIYLFLDRVEGREKERERNINVWLPLTYPPPSTGDLACNPGMCPD